MCVVLLKKNTAQWICMKSKETVKLSIVNRKDHITTGYCTTDSWRTQSKLAKL